MGSCVVAAPPVQATQPGQRTLPSLRSALVLAVLITACWLGIRLWALYTQPWPQPAVDDEFSYLLGADTLAHGRLANPPHPLSVFFESSHVLTHPAYASKYQAGQALWLALGQVWLGDPFWGVVLEGAALAFVMSLMFASWLTWRYAVAASILSVLIFQVPLLWMKNYMGGNVATIGTALVLFAMGQHLRRSWAPAGFFAAIGLLLLFLSRPYEGGVFAGAALVGWAWLYLRETGTLRFRRLVGPLLWALPVLLLGAAWIGLYNRAVTGNPLKLPYMLHTQQRDVAPVLWFMPLRPEPHYSNERLAAAHGLQGWEVDRYHIARSGRLGPVRILQWVVGLMCGVLGPTALLVLLSPFAWPNRCCRVLLMIITACLVSLSLETFQATHYAAPAIAVAALLAACTGEYLQSRKYFHWTAIAIYGISVAFFALRIYRSDAPVADGGAFQFGQSRAEFVRQMESTPGNHVVIVHYVDPKANPVKEWVYNHAEIDQQRVIFAHDHGDWENRVLTSYYRDRKTWLLTVKPDGKSILSLYDASPAVP